MNNPELPQLKIEQQKDNDKLVCKLAGWLDPNTSPDLLCKIDLTGIQSLIFDMTNIEYIFSSGLRVMLIFQKMMSENGGTMKLINVPEQIRSIFEDTGLDKMLATKV
jgi:anti-anti-sigma factor